MYLIDTYKRIRDKAITLRDRFQAHTAEVRAAQIEFQQKLEHAADVMGIENVERLMDGKAPVHIVNVWPEIHARAAVKREEAEKAEAARKARGPWISIAPYKGSAREAQDNFNRMAEAYIAKHGLEAFEQAMKPPPTPVPVSEPEPPARPPRRPYR